MADSRSSLQLKSGRTRGFTIVELLVTVTLAGILMAIAVPSFRSLLVGNRLTTQANDFVAAINLARSEAVKRNGNIQFCRTTGETIDTCATSQGVWQFWIVRTANGAVVRRGSINTYANTLVTRSTLVSDQLLFGADGLAMTGGALVNGQEISVCATNLSAAARNLRRVTLGPGSRLFTLTPTTGATCS